MSSLCFSGQLIPAENDCLVVEVATSEYTFVLFNIFAKSMQERTVSQEHIREAPRNLISRSHQDFLNFLPVTVWAKGKSSAAMEQMKSPFID